MPLTKRILYDSSTYHNEEIFHESTSGAVIPQQDPPTIIDNRNMSNMIGILNQLSVLSIFSLEMFHNLSLLTEDINDRVKIMSLRTNTLISKLPSVEKKVNSLDIEPELVLVNNRAKYLKNRDMLTPSLFIKKTNYSSITSQYKMCRTMPQLWRIETYIKNNDDCFKLYSYPGFFFQEWLRTEMITQEVKQEERKANKLIKKQLKTERRRQREEEREAALYLEQQRISAEEGDDEVEDFGSQDENLQSDEEFRGNNMKRKTLLPKKNKQRQISRDTDDHASSHGGDSTDGEKKKKGKMKKVTAKLANVFGFKKTDDEASETESVVAAKNKKLVSKDHFELASSKEHKDSRENKEKVTATTTPAGTSAPKSNALSMLFNNFTAKPNAATSTANAATIGTDDAHQSSAAQTGMSYKEFKESVGNNALPAASNTDGGAPPSPSSKFQKRPSMTMDSMSLSLLTNKFGPTTSSASAANNDGNNTAGNGASNIATAQSSQQVTAGADKDKSGAASPTPAAAPENNKNPVNLSAYTNAPAEDTTGEGDDMFNFSSLPQMNSRFDRNSKRLNAAAPPTSALVMKIGNNKTLTSKPRPRPSSVMRQPTFEYQHTGDLTMLTSNTMTAKKVTKNESPTPSERSSTSSRPSHSNNERLSNISRQSSSSTAHSRGRRGKKSGGGARYGSIEEEDFEEDVSLQDMDRNSSFDRRESSVNSDPNMSIDANNDEPDDEPEFDEDEPPPEDDLEFDDEFSDSPAKTTPKPPAPGAPRPPPPGPPGAGAGAPPPPPPPSLLLIKKAAPPPPPQPVEEEKVDTTRVNLLDAIRNANRNSTVNSAPSKHMSIDQQLIESKKLKVSTVKQNEAVAAILANRSKIAGDSDSDSDDSDSDYTDDGY